jgi:hypothetical protein
MRSSARTSKAPLAVTLVLAAALSGCSGGSSKASASPTASPTTSATPTPTPTASAAPVATDFLTGTTPRRSGPLVAIKVDNSVLARPYQRGLRQAAVVYQELVEGGSTRLLAVLESDTAGDTEIGPIRSVRESDIDLLREYGGITVGFSGGNTGVRAQFGAAARKGYVVDASYDAIPGAYRLGERRKDARNFFTTAGKLVSRHPGSGPRDIGLRFGRAVRGGVPAATATATYSPQSAVRIRYADGSYVLSQGGTVLPVSPANVVVQYVPTHASRYSDVHGMPTPFTVTTGTGKAVVLRDGVSVTGTWKRTGYGSTHFLDARGHDVPLKPGPTWVLLLPSRGSLSLG